MSEAPIESVREPLGKALTRRLCGRRSALLLALSVLAAAPACGDDAPTTPQPDLGTAPDGGPGDAGAGDGGRTDAGPPTDAGDDDAGDAGVADAGAGDAAPTDAGDADGDAETDAGTPLPPGAIVVDASDRARWTYVSVERGVVTVADPATSLDWDLAFRRALLQTNSGTSGPGVGGARRAPAGQAFEDVTRTDTIGFARDEVVATGMPGATPTSMNPVLEDWYDYDGTFHRVTPSDLVFVVRTARGGYAKLRIHAWDAGRFVLTLAPIEARPVVHTFTVDASSATDWVHLDLDAHAPEPATGVVVTPAEPAASAAWDLALRRTTFRTNSGTSGAAMGGAAATGVDLDALTSVAAPSGFTVDAELPPSRPGAPSVSASAVLSAWFDYDPVTHAVTPKAEAFLVRLADGSVGALRVDAYAAGMYALRFVYAGPGRDAL
jgi:hypothetical protein